MVGRQETLKLLSTLSETVLKKFVYSCTDEICGRKGPAVMDLQSQIQYSENEFLEVISHVKKLCCECIAFDGDLNKMKKKCAGLSDSHCNVFLACILTRKSEIIPYVNIERLNKSDHLLEDYDWRLKWVIGSSKFSAMHEPLLALDLHLGSRQGNKTMNLELDKAEVKLLIEALEKAQQSMKSA